MASSWTSDIVEKIENLQNQDSRFTTLQEMKDALSSIPTDEMRRTAPNLQLPLVFDCLNDSNTEQVDLACEVLSLCMNNLNLGESTNKYGVFLERALNHPHATVKLMALQEVQRNIGVDQEIYKKDSLLQAIIKCIADEQLSVAKKASEVIAAIATSSILGLKKFISFDVFRIIHEIMGISEVVKLRVFELVIDIGIKSEEFFNELKTTGIFEQIIRQLDSDDVLSRLNVLQLLSQLGVTKHGYEYLEENKIVDKLISCLDSDDVIGLRLCEPGILKFFGYMAHWKPMMMLGKYQRLYNRLFDNLDNKDFIIVGVVFDTMGYIGSVNEGKIALDAVDGKMDEAIKTIGSSMGSYPTQVKVKALSCLENLLKMSEPNNQISQLCHKWFLLISPDPINFIWTYAKNPFIDLRLGGLGILGAVAGHVWGQEIIKNTPGLVEFLLDRNIESAKESKEAKFAIVEILAESLVFDELTKRRLIAHVREGPFYVRAITEVAFEGNE